MAAHKLNVLHWHFTDSQSWPWQSQTFPELSAHGAYCPTCVYTRDDVRTVVTTAAALGIRVMVEVDFPGHSQAVGASHPEFLSLCDDNTDDVRSEPLDVTEPSVWQFVQDLYLELQQLFPDQWIHLGGDEVSLACWQNSTKIQAWMVQHNFTDTVQVLQYFEQDLIALVTGPLLGKRAIVWQDLFDSGVNLPRDTILDVWKEWTWEKSLNDTTAAGYDVLLSACWYLDHLNEDWWQFYQCDPLRGLRDSRQSEHVLGGHASMWGERVDATNFYEKVWPRASAVAEVLWSGSSIGSSKTEDSVSYSLVEARLQGFRCWLVQRFRLPLSPVAPGYCRGDEGPFHCVAR
jgi:hexosaminidase